MMVLLRLNGLLIGLCVQMAQVGKRLSDGEERVYTEQTQGILSDFDSGRLCKLLS